ncbi:hypothetical protein ACJRO7_022726 [Eucalyptus globulus]|uniref:Uncharacterized protein n=1 Tax=Eucalyptus globulus TaxID=34317 RepID=A0ABD3K496_EUCGL
MPCIICSIPSIAHRDRQESKLFGFVRKGKQMSGTGVFQPGASLAEVYVMRKLHKEKMKKAKTAEDAGAVTGDRKKEERTARGGGRGRFSLSRVFGKAHVHPSSAEAPHVAPSE